MKAHQSGFPVTPVNGTHSFPPMMGWNGDNNPSHGPMPGNNDRRHKSDMVWILDSTDTRKVRGYQSGTVDTQTPAKQTRRQRSSADNHVPKPVSDRFKPDENPFPSAVEETE